MTDEELHHQRRQIARQVEAAGQVRVPENLEELSAFIRRLDAELAAVEAKFQVIHPEVAE